MTIDDSIRNAITNRIQQRGMSDAELAQQLDMDPHDVQQLVHGNGSIVRSDLLDILNFLDLKLTVKPE